MIAYKYDSNTIHAEPIKSCTALQIKMLTKTIKIWCVAVACKHKYISLIMNVQTWWRITWNRRINSSNWCHQISTNGTHRIAPSRHSRIISLRDWCPHTPISWSISGVDFCHKQLSHWTYSINTEWPQPILPCTVSWIGILQCHSVPPPGTKVIVHIKPSIQKSWVPRGLDVCYIDHAKNHYCCFDIYTPQTWAVIHANTIDCFLHNYKIPFQSSEDNSTVAAV